ncbi:MAG: DUF3881 family protein [Hungatella sp.]
MHKFLRTVGFSLYQKRKDIEELLQQLVKESKRIRKVQIDAATTLCEIRAEVAPGMGLALLGDLDEQGTFRMEYYFPYLESQERSSDSECSIQRHTEKETYAGLLDEYKVGISLIYYLENVSEYQERLIHKESTEVEAVCLSALSIKGKVLLPIQKTAKQIQMEKVALKDRNSLLEAAKNGDEDAMETLTIEDIDLYAKISRRLMKEDIYSIIDSCFMPCGIECDQYAVLGEILRMETLVNRITQEEVYDLTLDCNDLIFHVAISKQDLIGEPLVGRRFKGQIWMQGTAKFKS